MDMSKYSCVLQPLKQLEEVWGIDLASTLQQYAADVAEVTVEMGGKALNFAEAALLIMGASSIYSKKVDALQQLVQDTYDLIINRRKADGKADEKKGARKRSRLMLRQPITFVETPLTPLANLYRDDIAETLRLMLAGCDQHAMHGGGLSRGVGSQFRSDGELVPFEDTATGGFNFRVSICATSSDGLLLPNVRQELVGNLTYENELITPRKNSKVHLPNTPTSLSQSLSRSNKDDITDEQGFKRVYEEELKKALAEAEDAASTDDGGDDKASDDDAGDDAPVGLYEKLTALCRQDRFAVTVADRPWERYVIGDKLSAAAAEPTKQLVQDLLCDKTLSLNASACVAETDALGGLIFSMAQLAKNPACRMKDLDEARGRAKERLRKDIRDALRTDQEDTGVLLDSAEGDVEKARFQPATAPLPDLDIDCDDGGDLCSVAMEPEMEHSQGGALAPVEKAVGAEASSLPDNGEDFFSAGIARMNELLHASHIRSNEKQAMISHEEASLHLRIAQWQERIEPLLEEQSARPVFDIHVYAKRILEAFDAGVGQQLSFTSLLQKCCIVTYEISRFFLTLLQLSNTQNVHLDFHYAVDGTRSDAITITLQSSQSVFNFDSADVEAMLPPSKRPRRN